MREQAPPSPSPAPAPAPEKVYYDGCPGCEQERKKETCTGVPYKELCFVGITTLASSLPISSLFPFLYFMIRDLNIAKREEDIGFYAGFLGASYMIGRGFASIFWGIVADRIGRKPVIAFSIFSVIIFNTLFGLSVKYWMAITTRLLLGALNGLLAPIKAYAIEVCRVEHQALGLSIVSTAWGIGLVVGPAIGGYLAQPVKQYPHLFSEKSTFKRFPYLLPCLCISLFAVFVLVSCIWLPETLHKHKGLEKEVEMVEASTTQQSRDSSTKRSLFKNWPLMSSIITYCVFSLHDTAYSEIFSLWTVSDRKYGGLSFSTKDVGQVLAVAGASLLVYQLLIYQWVDKILGPINSARIASVLSMPILAAYPFMTHLSGLRLGLALYPAAMVKSVLAITITTGTCLLQNNAVPQGQRGAANGIATTMMSLFKAVAPAGAGVIFSWAQKRQHGAFMPALPISSLFPFLYFMIRDLHVAKQEEDIGLYAGILAASYMVGRCFASVFWGAMADRIGRKPIISFSILSVVIFNTLFGLSTKYWMAITTRLLLGALNGMLAPIKAYSIEVCRPEHQALGLSVVSSAWGIGLVVGPAIGGFFAQPAEQYPHLFPTTSIFGRFPYFLPCLCISLIAAVVLLSCIWLPETLHMHKNLEREVEMVEDSRTLQREDSSSNKSLFKNWSLMSSIIAYCVFTLHDTAYSEIFSLWAISDRKYGGLSFSSKEVGQVLAVAGASLLVYQLSIYRWVHKFLGPVNSSRVASALSIPIIAAYPFMTHLSGVRLGVALYLATMIKNVLSATINTGTSLLQNYAVPQSQRGAANGISTTAMSFFKAIAPAGAGALFSWAQKRQNAAFFPGDQMVFLVLNLVEILGFFLTFKPFLAVPEQYDFK